MRLGSDSHCSASSYQSLTFYFGTLRLRDTPTMNCVSRLGEVQVRSLSFSWGKARKVAEYLGKFLRRVESCQLSNHCHSCARHALAGISWLADVELSNTAWHSPQQSDETSRGNGPLKSQYTSLHRRWSAVCARDRVSIAGCLLNRNLLQISIRFVNLNRHRMIRNWNIAATEQFVNVGG